MRITGKTLDETDKKILEMISRGKTYKEISKTLYLKFHSLSYRIRQMKKQYKCLSVPQLIAHLIELDLV